MSDYIKKEDAKDAVINVVGWESIANYLDEMSKHFCTKDNDYYDALMDAEDAIDDLPPADVAPVGHGRWKPFDRTWGRSVFTCTACGDAMDVPTEMGNPLFVYCPNCGARMDGEDDETDRR